MIDQNIFGTFHELRSQTTFKTEDWYQHLNLRADHVEVYAQSLSPGTYSFKYHVRVLHAGCYLAAPAVAKQMNQPKIRGSSASSRIIVLPK